LDREDYALAQQDLETAYRYVPENSEMNFALGLLWQQREDSRRAETFYAKALEINPRHVGAWNNLGVLAGKEKAWAVAIRFFGKALAIEPADAKTQYLQARAYAELGQWESAQASIDAALQLNAGQKEYQDLARLIATRGPLPKD